jgi:hypothetical protein
MARVWQFVFVAMLSIASAVFSQEVTKRADYDDLLSQLQSDRSEEREAATDAILEIGDDIRPWIAQGAKNPSLEVRLRCRQLLTRIDSNSYSRRVEAFRNSGDIKAAADLPCWSEFRGLFGSDEKARDLYCDILLRERSLMEQFAAFKRTRRETSGDISNAINQARLTLHARPLQSSLESASMELVRGRAALSAESLCACVLVVSEPDLTNHKAISQAVFGYFRDAENVTALRKSPHYPAARTGVTRWLAGSSARVYPLDIALRLGLSDLALSLGRKAVANYATVDSEFIDEASQAAVLGIMACGRFGDRSDIERLAPLLEKKIAVQTWLTVDQQVATGQLRDLALVYSAYLAGQDVKALGFTHLETRADTIFVPYTVTFVDDEQREAAHRAWMRIRNEQVKKSAATPRTNAG